MHRLQLETMLSACLRHAEQRDNLAEKLEGSETVELSHPIRCLPAIDCRHLPASVIWST